MEHSQESSNRNDARTDDADLIETLRNLLNELNGVDRSLMIRITTMIEILIERIVGLDAENERLKTDLLSHVAEVLAAAGSVSLNE